MLAVVGLVIALFPAPAGALPRAASDGASTPWPGGRWQPDAPTYGMVVDANVTVTMDDGVKLVANIGYPSDLATGEHAWGPFPVLLTQAPYVASQQPTPFYVTRGYIHAVVQVRGTGDTSGPDGEPISNDIFAPRQAKDGVALVDWAAKLPTSNGKVGMQGCSQLGINQIFTAAAVGPDSPLEVILPACASNGYEGYFSGGMPSQILGLFGSFPSASLSGAKNGAVNDAAGKAIKAEVLAGGPKAYDRAYWQARSTARVMPKVVENKIPALLWSGWQPTDGPGSLYEYSILQNAWAHRPPFGAMSPEQRTTGRYQIIIGPWKHGQGLDDSIQLEWYDTWLKGEDTGIADTTTPMHLFELQSNRWVNVTTYPLTHDYTALHLAADGELSTSAPKTAGSATMQWGDPATSGTTVTFDAAPLDSDQVVAGPVGATIYAKSSNRNLNLIATLNDVAPDGQVNELVTGSIVGSLRAVDTKTSWHRRGWAGDPPHPSVPDRRLREAELAPALRPLAHADAVVHRERSSPAAGVELTATGEQVRQPAGHADHPAALSPECAAGEDPSGRVHDRLERVVAVVGQRAPDGCGNAARGDERTHGHQPRGSRTARLGRAVT